ncbi:type I-E CRISPR-associated endonuclease Cas1e [uncultured Desulfovibrio sp.]|uniref:type I-E CRISPR-associated endonuclease Cas1e n=1 Tax=uncultured Desulfovibrio sp. TaxID=167968 RepID=UPI002602DB0B|nr:type I-E CRISPR-associated endonuclease Cas1e [uncultured Desulfovibrio sp.]
MRLDSEVIPLRERSAMLFLRCGRLDVEDGALVLAEATGVRMQIPLGGIACLLLEPGTTVTHAAVALAADCGTLLLWIGEGGVRLYSAGQPGGARSDKLLYQAKLALTDELRLRVVRAMYRFRFGDEPPRRRSIEQLRGIEGVRVRTLYKELAARYRISWGRRSYDPGNWDAADPVNKAVSVANHCLYGICEAAVLAAGYAPAIGFIHTGKPLSFVYDVADLFKFDTVIPVAFRTVAEKSHDIARDVRLRCRDMFREQKLLRRIIPVMEEVLAAAGEPLPQAHPEAVPVAFPEKKGLGDAGHRY